MSRRLMLDTNAVSSLLKARAGVVAKLLVQRGGCISVITEAEIRFGMTRPGLHRDTVFLAERFLGSIDILPWTSDCARQYGSTRSQLERAGKPLAPMDLLIAAHALAERCTLVSADKVFAQVPGLDLLHSTDVLA